MEFRAHGIGSKTFDITICSLCTIISLLCSEQLWTRIYPFDIYDEPNDLVSLDPPMIFQCDNELVRYKSITGVRGQISYKCIRSVGIYFCHLSRQLIFPAEYYSYTFQQHPLDDYNDETLFVELALMRLKQRDEELMCTGVESVKTKFNSQ